LVKLFSILQIGDEKINVHRCILAQNSNVFLTMFKQKDMIEAKNVLITVKSR